jgi:hypothetical protein
MAKKISASDIFAEEDIFLGIRQSAEKTILTFQEIDAEFKKMGANLKKELTSADFGNTKGINEFVSATQKANQAKEESIKIDKILSQATKDMAAADKALIDIEIKKQKLAQEQLRTNQQIAKSEEAKAKAASKAAQASKVQMDSYKGLAASTRDLKNQSKELGAQLLSLEKSGQKSTAAYSQLEQQFREVTAAAQAGDAELKSIDKTVGDNFRNVGNYEEATKGLKQQLREMTQALQNMETTDPRFRQMSIDAGNLKDQINDTNAVIKSTAGSAVENLGTGIAKAGKVGIDAFAGMTGAMGLFGIESESAMQAMLKLQQLAAVSEALSSLGALGDTMTEVKAAFIAAASKLGLLTAAKEVDIVVTETQTAVTEVATVATSGLGKAMKAVPIVAIIAGIIALVAAVASYVSSNEEAEKALEKRRAAEKRANEEAKKMRETVAAESSAFVTLIYQLKQTNANSKQRKDLMNQINSQYGTTLKNISDETAFQAQLNLAVQDYIKYQKEKYMLAKNDKLIQANLAKQDQLTAQWNKTKKANVLLDKDYLKAAEGDAQARQRVIASIQKSMASSQSDYTKTMEYKNLQRLTDEYNKYQAEMLAADARLQAYTKSSLQLTNSTANKYIPVTNKSTTATQANEKAMKSANDEIERTIQLITESQTLIDEIGLYETQMNLESAVQNQLDSIQESGKYQLDLINQLIEEEYNLQKAIIERQYLEKLDSATSEQEVINAQIKRDFELGKLEEQRAQKTSEITKQLETEQENYADKQIKNDEKVTKSAEDSLKKQQDFIKLATDFFVQQSERKVAQIDKEISAAEKQFETFKTLAENGNINAKESLAEQQRIINEANARKEKEMKRQQRIKLAESVYSTYTAKVAAGSEHPLMETIKDTMLLQQFIASLPTFFDGTEDTGKNGNGIDGKGGFHAVLHPNERVIPKSLNEQIGSLSNEALAKMANEYQNGKLMRSNSQMGSALETALLISKLDELTDTIKMKPETNIGIGEITQSVMEIVKSTKQGNTTTYNRYKVRR